MNKKTLKALKDSIQHWEDLAAGYGGSMNRPNSSSCALCQLFYGSRYEEDREDCQGCPVSKKTGRPFCEGTPYERVGKMWQSGQISHIDNFAYLRTEDFRTAAREMVKFLWSLMPTTEEKEPKKAETLLDGVDQIVTCMRELVKQMEIANERLGKMQEQNVIANKAGGKKTLICKNKRDIEAA
jgi:hypothetical protein